MSASLRSCIAQPEQVHFVKCLNEKSSCPCLLADGAFRSCLGPCAPMLLGICGKDTGAPKTWKPSASDVLHYSAQQPPLHHVDGIYVINLKRRPDRLQSFLQSSGFAPSDVHVFEAVDGRALTLTEEIKTLFGRSDYKYHRGYISATLSHYKLWRHIASTTNELHLVLEDDGIFPKDFIALWNNNYSHALPRGAQLVYLGGMMPENFWSYKSGSVLEPVNDYFARHQPTLYFSHEYLDGVDNFTRGAPTRRYFYTSIAYLISSNAARSLVDMVATFGFRKAVDHTLYRVMAWTPDTFATTPLLVAIPPRLAHNDSDVQYESNLLEDAAARGAAAERGFKLTSLPTRTSNMLATLGDTPTFVLTTEAHLERLRSFHAHALRAGLKYAPKTEVDGAQITVEQLQASGALGAAFPASARGTAAVGVSHIMLLEELADDPDASHYLILEDDAIVPPDFFTKVDQALSTLPPGWHMLNLGCPADTCGGLLVDKGIVLPDQKCVSGLNGYIVSKEGADVLLSLAIPLHKAIDQQIRAAYGTTLRAYCTRPHIVAHDSALPQPRAQLDA